MNRIFKNALMVTLLISAGVTMPAEATLQSDISVLAGISLGDIGAAVGETLSQSAQGWAIIGKAVLATTPRDVYNFVSHPDTLAVAGMAAAGYAIYKYVNPGYYCDLCSRESDVIEYQGKLCCVPCFDKWVQSRKALCAAQQVEAALAETHAVLDETNVELSKLQVAMQELSNTTKVS